MKKSLWLLPVLLCVCSISCANLVQVKIDVVDQRTALENQVLGSYQEIDGDLMLMASVRSIDNEGRLKPAPVIPEGKRAAIMAMQRSRFNLDDIERFKTIGAIGETMDGYLAYRPIGKTRADPKLEKFVNHLITEENRDRKILYERIVVINDNLVEGDLPKVERILSKLNHDNAKPGEWIQLDTGEWIQKGKK